MGKRAKFRAPFKKTVPFVADMRFAKGKGAMSVGEKIVYKGQEGTIRNFVHVIAEVDRVILVGEMEVNE